MKLARVCVCVGGLERASPARVQRFVFSRRKTRRAFSLLKREGEVVAVAEKKVPKSCVLKKMRRRQGSREAAPRRQSQLIHERLGETEWGRKIRSGLKMHESSLSLSHTRMRRRAISHDEED